MSSRVRFEGFNFRSLLRWPPVGEQCLEEQSLSLPHRIRRSATASAVSFKFNRLLVGRQNRTANYFSLFWEN